MNIAMVTNSYLPNINGVARSVEAFQRGYRRSGHNVLVVAPAYDRADPESNVIRIPSLQRFNGSDFSVAVPVPSGLFDALEEFEPDIIHSHHPFLLGDTALRAASRLEIGLVFTHHTHYEQYTQYVPGDSPGMKRFIVKLSTGYANLADLVIAPSESTARLLRSRGVERPISVVPTGVESDSLRRGSGGAMRAILGIPGDAFVIGHLGRLSAEKNLDFLSAALVETLRAEPDVHFLLGGAGECRRLFESRFGEAGLADRLHLTGSVQGAFLASAYKAMDVFAFTSQSETQGMVLVEAMACENRSWPSMRRVLVRSCETSTMVASCSDPRYPSLPPHCAGSSVSGRPSSSDWATRRTRPPPGSASRTAPGRWCGSTRK